MTITTETMCNLGEGFQNLPWTTIIIDDNGTWKFYRSMLLPRPPRPKRRLRIEGIVPPDETVYILKAKTVDTADTFVHYPGTVETSPQFKYPLIDTSEKGSTITGE